MARSPKGGLPNERRWPLAAAKHISGHGSMAEQCMPGGSLVLTSTVVAAGAKRRSKLARPIQDLDCFASLAMTPVAGSFYFGCSFSAAELMQ
jgi:hypothetical protein